MSKGAAGQNSLLGLICQLNLPLLCLPPAQFLLQFSDMLVYAKEQNVITLQYVDAQCIPLHDVKVLCSMRPSLFVHPCHRHGIFFSASWTLLFLASRTPFASSRKAKASCLQQKPKSRGWNGWRFARLSIEVFDSSPMFDSNCSKYFMSTTTSAQSSIQFLRMI